MNARIPLVLFLLSCGLTEAQAGMTVYELSDIVKLRLQDISFFGVLLIIAVCGVRWLWNSLCRDFPKLPRLTFRRAFCLTALLGLAMLLVLVMISGARELLTPGAWRRQGSHYRPNDLGSTELRQQGMEALKVSLMQYAHAHAGKFPPHDYVPEIAARLWEAPDSTGSRYIYLGDRNLGETNRLVACEPLHFGDERLVLLADGEIRRMTTQAIRALMQGKSSP